MSQFRVDVLVHGENRWATNALRFETEAEANRWAKDLFGRWMAVSLLRVVPASTPDREPYEAGSETTGWRNA